MKRDTLILSLVIITVGLLHAQQAREYQVVFKPGSQDEFISITTPEGKTFKQVRVVAATVDKLKIIHAEGAASLPMKEMPGEIKGRFNYDKLKAQAAGVSSPAPVPFVAVQSESSANANEGDDILGIIRAAAEKEWPGNFRMQQYEIDAQTAAALKYGKYLESGVPGVPEDVMTVILYKAHQEWGHNYLMNIHEVESQVKAWQKLNP